MRLTRYHEQDSIIPGVFVSDTEILNCSSFGEDWGETFFASDGLDRLAAFLESDGATLPRVQSGDVKLAPAIAQEFELFDDFRPDLFVIGNIGALHPGLYFNGKAQISINRIDQ